MIPAFHDYSLEPKITKCGDLLYWHQSLVMWFCVLYPLLQINQQLFELIGIFSNSPKKLASYINHKHLVPWLTLYISIPIKSRCKQGYLGKTAFFFIMIWLQFSSQCCENALSWELKSAADFNPNWQETGHFYPSCSFRIGFCQLNLYQKFPNFFGGENWHQSG